MRRLACIVAIATAAAGARADGGPAHLRLRAQATVPGAAVTLADVLILDGADPELVQRISAAAILPPSGRATATAPAGPRRLTITYEQVRRRLDELGVNLGRVLLSGAAECAVLVQPPAPARPLDSGTYVLAAAEEPAAEAPLLRAPAAASAARSGQRTLADMLRAQVDGELRELGGSAEVRFDGTGREFLELTTPPWEFQVATPGGDKLGLREFRVTIRRAGRLQRTAHVFAEVRLVRPVVVARRPLSLGNFVRAEDVGLETRVFEHTVGLGPTAVEAVVGQQVRQFVPAGGAIGPDALKAVDLVQRSRPVTVLGSRGASVQIRLNGVALDAGGYGETVRVRLGEGRNDRPPVSGVVTGLGTVRLLENQP